MGSRFDSDPGEYSKVRETDVVAEEPTVRSGYEILVVVECKHAGRPWVVRCQEGPAHEERVNDLIAHSSLRKALLEYVQAHSDQLPFLIESTHVGFGVGEGPEQEATKEGNRRARDLPFPAMQSAVAAARALGDRKSAYDDLWLVWPVVVIEGELWRVAPGPSGRPEVAAVPWQRIRWREAPRTEAVSVDIVTRSALAEYVQALRADTMWLAEWMPDTPPSVLIA
jgi:hypothetical protein